MDLELVLLILLLFIVLSLYIMILIGKLKSEEILIRWNDNEKLYSLGKDGFFIKGVPFEIHKKKKLIYDICEETWYKGRKYNTYIIGDNYPKGKLTYIRIHKKTLTPINSHGYDYNGRKMNHGVNHMGITVDDSLEWLRSRMNIYDESFLELSALEVRRTFDNILYNKSRDGRILDAKGYYDEYCLYSASQKYNLRVKNIRVNDTLVGSLEVEDSGGAIIENAIGDKVIIGRRKTNSKKSVYFYDKENIKEKLGDISKYHAHPVLEIVGARDVTDSKEGFKKILKKISIPQVIDVNVNGYLIMKGDQKIALIK